MRLASLGPDILGVPPDFDAMLARIDRAESDRYFGDILQDQRLIAGIGNMWMAETLWHARLSPWQRLSDVARDDRLRALETAAALMRASVDAGREQPKSVHGRAGRACPRCGTPVRSWGQGDANRIAYWCPSLSALARRTRFTHAPNLQQVQRQRDGEKQKDRSCPQRRVFDLVFFRVDEDGRSRRGGQEEGDPQLRSRGVSQLDHPRDEPAWRRGAIARVLGIALGEPQLLRVAT